MKKCQYTLQYILQTIQNKIKEVIKNAKRENEKGVLDINLFLSNFEEIEDYKSPEEEYHEEILQTKYGMLQDSF